MIRKLIAALSLSSVLSTMAFAPPQSSTNWCLETDPNGTGWQAYIDVWNWPINVSAVRIRAFHVRHGFTMSGFIGVQSSSNTLVDFVGRGFRHFSHTFNGQTWGAIGDGSCDDLVYTVLAQ